MPQVQPVLLDDLQAFFAAYIEAFRSREPQEVLRLMQLPVTRVTTARQSVLEDEEAAEDSVLRMIEKLDAGGVANARIATIELVQATHDSAMVKVRWELMDGADVPLLGYDVGYTLARTGEHRWRIAAIEEAEGNRAFQQASAA